MMNRMRSIGVLTAIGLLCVGLALNVGAQQEKPKLGYKDTPMLPGGKWHVHDGDLGGRARWAGPRLGLRHGQRQQRPP